MEILTRNKILQKFHELGICYLSPSFIRDAKTLRMKKSDNGKRQLFNSILLNYVTDEYLKDLAIAYCAEECQLKDVRVYTDTNKPHNKLLILHYYFSSELGHRREVFATSEEIDPRSLAM